MPVRVCLRSVTSDPQQNNIDFEIFHVTFASTYEIFMITLYAVE